MKTDTYGDVNRIYPPLDLAFDFMLGPKICEEYYASHDTQVMKIISSCPSEIDYDKYLYFTILNYGRRFTLLLSIIHQYLCNVGLPMLDYELMDFCLKIPFDYKANSRLYRDIIISSFPEIGNIPWSRNRLPLHSRRNRHHVCYYLEKVHRLKYYLTRLSHSRVETLPKHNKNRMFRKDKTYRNYFLNLIFNERTFDKGYVSKTGLEKIVRLIDSGGNYFDLLEKVAVIELISRELEIG